MATLMRTLELTEFDLTQALNGATVVTREGEIVKDLAYFPNAFETKYKVRGTVNGFIWSFEVNGKSCTGKDSSMDLFIFQE